MTPAARIQAAIEVLDGVIDAARHQGPPADRLIAQWFRDHRFAGSKDKRAIRELVYDTVRICGPVPRSGRAAMLALAEASEDHDWIAAQFDGSQYGPPAIREGEPVADVGYAPEWLEDLLFGSDIDEEQAAALLDRAPLDVRVNRLKATREGLALPVAAEELPVPGALRLPTGTPVDQWPEYADGIIEVQDLGSQLACLATGAQPGDSVIDLCAGAGGKTLALAAMLNNRGTLVAADTDRRRLSQLAPRAERAGAEIGDTVLLDPGREFAALEGWRGAADRVLVDAPCSGTGTWRRNPEARWRLTANELERLTALQWRLLGLAAQLVRPGGSLTYVVCSVLDAEGAGQVDAFLAANPGWHAETVDLPAGRPRGKGVRLSPAHDGTDGFFIARLGKA
ncbi:RsmB/NOP family class I SAM-dependent RNA methyltransferase [Erythrobacter arachoides]|uniref:RsmB/NOP family class I SAM-dependent RNA methyltransferase n=1 Tax=Aurantiacibacter arachoides TaxID=1850444 RepID=A0A845A108_9SPHN|nr:RsmB/NOP family class I SAM-dependent RNA methyltransferase [Aurantiacibacter arachoides]MXO93404.1 RsmB/NOP family class I SAM-dependent RNA methyltransferase [Aurantiacibacter arachoides]GGD49634.1 MFS transporter [Aurantiacibacter arachoides]